MSQVATLLAKRYHEPCRRLSFKIRFDKPSGKKLIGGKEENDLMAKRKINAKEFLSDVRAGMDDVSLMDKYGLSARGVLLAMNRLIWEGLMSPSELAERRSLAKTVYMPIYKCPVCNEIQFSKGEKCPKCGVPVRSLSEKKSPFA